MGASGALRIGLADECFGGTVQEFTNGVRKRAIALAAAPELDQRIASKKAARAADEAMKPLSAYREEELARLQLNFYGFDPSYHVARYNFVRKVPESRTPLTIARHRDRRLRDCERKAP